MRVSYNCTLWRVLLIGSMYLTLFTSHAGALSLPEQLSHRSLYNAYLPPLDSEGEAVELRLCELARAHQPQGVVFFNYLKNSVERTYRHTTAMRSPLSQYQQLSARAQYTTYHLYEGDQRNSDHYSEMELRIDTDLYSNTWYYAPVLSTTNNHNSLGLRSGYTHRSDTSSYTFTTELWTPWSSNALAARFDARQAAIRGEYNLSYDDISMQLYTGTQEIYISDAPWSVLSHEGTTMLWGAQCNYYLWQQPEHLLATGYLGEQSDMNSDYLSSSLSFFIALNGERFTPATDETRIPREEHSLKISGGIDATYVISEYIGWQTHLALGADAPRSINAGNLYEVQSRIYIIPQDTMRLWFGLGTESQRTDGLAQGATLSIICGTTLLF